MTRRINRSIIVFLPLSLLLLSSCNSNVVFSDTHAMAENTWKLMEIPSFRAEVDDTLASSNIFFTLRSSSSYQFRNIWLFVTTIAPDGKSITDTLQFNLADEKGKSYGRGFGDIRELDLPYKSNVYFPLKGIYQFRIQHGMRVEDLKGVYDFGLRIEKIPIKRKGNGKK
jgi:gliding motility-associated lipoprotein GldH